MKKIKVYTPKENNIVKLKLYLKKLENGNDREKN